MKASRKLSTLALLLTAAMLFTLVFTACTKANTPAEPTEPKADTTAADTTPEQTDETSDTESTDSIYIAAFSKGFQHKFYVSEQEGMQAACDEYGATLTFEAPDASNQNINAQIELIEAALGRNPSALLIASFDATAIAPTIEQATEQGVAVFTFDNTSNSDKIVGHYGTDCKAAGALAAEKMAEAIGYEGEVAIVSIDQVSNGPVDRRDGFVEYMEANCPNIKIVDIQYNADDALKSLDICTSYLLNYENLKGIYACSQSCSEGMIQAIEEQDRVGDVVLIGFDSGAIMQNAVRNGTMLGAITQDPYMMGYLSAKAACEYVLNGVVPEEVINDSGSVFYTKDNIDTPEVQKMLYE